MVATWPALRSGHDLRHQRQRPLLWVVEERHPLLHAGLMAEDEVRRVGELHSPRQQLLVGGVNVVDAEVDHRLRAGRAAALRLAEEEPRATAVEEGQRAVGV